jgi:glucose-1-phosphate thymidylyltransferase
MNIIIPMAGLGKRLRPHTLTTPKPLLPIAGKPIVHRLVEDIAKVCPEKIDTIGFIIHPTFGKDVEESLKTIASDAGAVGKIYYQEKAMGISHALLSAKEIFKGKVIVAFADTLFKAEFKLDTNQDGIVWVQRVSDPSQFGVVRLNDKGEIIELVEKPTSFVSDLAIIGIYFFKDGAALAAEMQYLIDNNIKDKGEFQFTSALQNFSKKGAKLIPGLVAEWLDCGNKNVTVQTNQRYLELIKDKDLVSKKIKLVNSLIISPCFVGDGAVIENSIIGPYVSVGENSRISDSRIKNSIIQKEATLRNAMLENSMLGNFTIFEGPVQDLSIGDFNSITPH